MSTKVAELTVDEFKRLLEETMELRPEFEQRLRRSLAYVAAGGKTLSLEELTARLEME